jgi:hypothetical protein
LLVAVIVGANVAIPLGCLTRIAGADLPDDPSSLLIPDDDAGADAAED